MSRLFVRGFGTLAGLVVDDTGLAISALAWIAVATALLPQLVPDSAARAICLFGGIAAALVASVLRRARRA